MGFVECIVLVVDLLILRACYKSYSSSKHAIKSLEGAPELPIDASLKSYVQQQKDEKVPYAVICGRVTAIGAPIESAFSPMVTGVLQKIKIFEFKVVQGLARLWTNQRKLVDLEINEVPFMITNGKHGVEVTEALSAAMLDLDVIYNSNEPSLLRSFGQFFGFFSALKERFHTTEEILPEGSLMTAVGEIKLYAGNLRLQPSSAGPFFLTTATKGAIIKKLEEAKSSMMVKMFICGTISAVLIGIIGRRYFIRKKAERDERRLKETLEKAREKKANLVEELLCVVCISNPIEVICLPCGHVCLCKECSERIRLTCPVCRTEIESKAAAFIS